MQEKSEEDPQCIFEPQLSSAACLGTLFLVVSGPCQETVRSRFGSLEPVSCLARKALRNWSTERARIETSLMACGRHDLARFRKIASREHGSRKSTTYVEMNAVEIRSVSGQGRRLEVSLKHSHQVTEEFTVLHHQGSVLYLGENVTRPTNYPKYSLRS